MGSPTVIVENKADPSAQRRLRKHYLTLARNNIDLTSLGLFPPVDNPTNEISPSESTEPTESVGREWIKRVRKDMALCHRQIRKGMTDEIVVQQMAIIDEHRHACDKRIERANRRFSVLNERHIPGEAAEQITSERHRIVFAAHNLSECRGQLFQLRLLLLSRRMQLRREERTLRESKAKEKKQNNLVEVENRTIASAVAFTAAGKKLLPPEWRERLRWEASKVVTELKMSDLPTVQVLVDENKRLKKMLRTLLWESIPIVRLGTQIESLSDTDRGVLAQQLSLDDVCAFSEHVVAIQQESMRIDSVRPSVLADYRNTATARAK